MTSGSIQRRSPSIGVDVLKSRELRRLVERDWFMRYCFAADERAHADLLGPQRRNEFLAGRFAAKEAVLKALGKGILQGIPPRDICVLPSHTGAPAVSLRGSASELASSENALFLSIAHKEDVVTAVAMSLPVGHLDQKLPDAGQDEAAAMAPPESDEAAPIIARLRVRIGHEDAHYGGEVVDGAHILKLFGDLVTEITIKTDGDEGLLAEYSAIKFTAPVKPGDYLEFNARLVGKKRLRRVVELEAWKVIAAVPSDGPSKAELLEEPQLVCSATAVTVVPVRQTTAARES